MRHYSDAMKPFFAQCYIEPSLEQALLARTPLKDTFSRVFITLIDALAWSTSLVCLVALSYVIADRLEKSSATARSWRVKLATWRSTATQSASAHEVTALSAGGALASLAVVGAATAARAAAIGDAASLAVLALVFATIGAALLALGALLSFVASPVGSGAVWRKVVFDDIVNFGLYVLRVFLC
mgnify:FL=1